MTDQCTITRDKFGMLAILSAPEIFLCTRESIQELINRNNEGRAENKRLQSEIDRLLDENADLKFSLGVKSEPGEPFCR